MIRLSSVLCAALLAGTAQAQTRYTVTNLGTFTGTPTSSSFGYAVNNSGMVTGSSTTSVPGQEHAFRSSAAGEALTLTDLGTFGGRYSYGYAINDSGVVAGASSFDDSNTLHAFRSEAGQLTDFGTFGGPTSLGFGINSRGEVAGAALDSEYRPIAFRSEAFGASGPITNPLPERGGEGYAINESGMVAGHYLRGITEGGVYVYHAFRSGPTGEASLTDLGTLIPGTAGNRFQSIATGINASGATSGSSDTVDGTTRAFRSSPVGEAVALTDLGTLGGGKSYGLGINDSGLVVGRSEFVADNERTRAFIYDTRMSDLNDLVDNLTAAGFKELVSAQGISNTGFITGYGTTLDGSTRAFLLTPTPEPATVLGLSAACLGLAGWFRRKTGFRVSVRSETCEAPKR